MSTKDKNGIKIYSEEEFRTLFERIQRHKFQDVYVENLVLEETDVYGKSTSIDNNVYIDLDHINKYHLTVLATAGIIANKLAHQWYFQSNPKKPQKNNLWNNNISINNRRELENITDSITIKRGYGRPLLTERRTYIIRFADNPQKLELLQEIRNSPQDLELKIGKYERTRENLAKDSHELY